MTTVKNGDMILQFSVSLNQSDPFSFGCFYQQGIFIQKSLGDFCTILSQFYTCTTNNYFSILLLSRSRLG